MEERGHAIIPSSGLVPENDPTTLFTGSGMQPLLPYLLGEKHPKGTRIADSQKCFRAEDIEEVGDNRHTTFFEMLGNWSLGDYFKKDQLAWFFEFLTKEIGLDPSKLYITVFDGAADIGIPRDEESITIWQELLEGAGVSSGFQAICSEKDGYKSGMNEDARIFSYDATKNWWSRAGVPKNMPIGEPGGPDSEVFYDFETEHDKSFGEYCHPNCDCGRFLEIGNNVFMEYLKTEDGFEKLKQQNVDFGGGLERITAAANGDADVFTIDIFADRIKQLEQLCDKEYSNLQHQPSFRIIADHIRAAEAMIVEDILPSNTEQGYFVRRLIRRSIIYSDKLGVPAGKLSENDVIKKEEEKFRATLTRGLKEFNKRAEGKEISGADAFILFTTYGFPIELTEELAAEKSLRVDRDGFDTEMKKHKETSRAGAEQKFKGGLADNSEKTTAFHTATHLILAGLRKYLSKHVTQRGSNITSERVRFDFTHHEKVSREILDKVEDYVNDAIAKNIPVTVEEMSKSEAKESGAVGAFWEKYPDVVTVYTIAKGVVPPSRSGAEQGGVTPVVYSRELCGGPHVTNTGDLAKFGTFKIKKESSSSAGVRRIKAVFVVE